MKILILGAGQVGRTAADHLSREEANEVTVVDVNEDTLRDVQDRFDVRTVAGNAAHPNVLEAAGAAEAEIIVALTSSDEVNLVACLLRADFVMRFAFFNVFLLMAISGPPLCQRQLHVLPLTQAPRAGRARGGEGPAGPLRSLLQLPSRRSHYRSYRHGSRANSRAILWLFRRSLWHQMLNDAR